MEEWPSNCAVPSIPRVDAPHPPAQTHTMFSGLWTGMASATREGDQQTSIPFSPLAIKNPEEMRMLSVDQQIQKCQIPAVARDKQWSKVFTHQKGKYSI